MDDILVQNTELDLDSIQQEIEQRQSTIQVPVPAEQQPLQQIHPLNAPSAFTDVVDQAKIKTVTNVAATDKHFVKQFADQITNAALESARVEQEKQRLEKQAVEYQQELLETRQQLNKLEQQTNKWDKRQKRRQFFYDGVKPILQFVNINEPMNILLTTIMVVLILPFFLVHKFLKGSIGVLISGATADDRPQAVKNFLWTILAVIISLVLLFVIFLVLKYYGIINIRQGG